MTEKYIAELLKICVAKICDNIGWHSIQPSALEIIIDLLDRYLIQLSIKTKYYGEMCNRHEPNLNDLAMAFQNMNINLNEIAEFINFVHPLTLNFDVSKFPLKKETYLNLPNPDGKDLFSPNLFPDNFFKFDEESEKEEQRNENDIAMADEWADEGTTSAGKKFNGGDYKSNYNDEWGNGGGEDNAYGGQDTNDQDNEDQNGYGDRNRRGGGGRGRGGRGRGGGRGGGYGDRGGFNDNRDPDENGDGFDRRGRGRGRGGGRGSGRGGFGDGDGDGDRDRSNHNNNNGEATDKKELYIPPKPTEDENEIFGQGISSGINFDKYEKIPVKVSGDNAPKPILSFEGSGLKDFVLTNVRKSGYTTPTPIQKNAIPIIMNKRDLMACAQTGSGKTAAFLLPIVHELLSANDPVETGKPQALIISPTRELTIQIFEEARKFALSSYLKVSIAYGGTAVKHQGDNISKGCHILVATPGRLIDFVDRSFITFEDTRFVVLDEADRMLDMGFLPNVEKVMNHETMRAREDRQTLMFSATFPEEIQRLAGQFLRDYIFLAVGIVGGACSDVEQTIYELGKHEKRKKLIEILESDLTGGKIVFVEKKRDTDFLASLLSEKALPTTSIHGDRLQREREQAIRDFKSGKMSVLIATSVAARGLDIKNVNHVINYDLPKSIDDYVHRIGRTGRLGNRGKATSFYNPDVDSALGPDLVKILEQAGQDVPDFLRDSSATGGSYSNNEFGGRDVRGNNLPTAQEPDEQW